MSFTSNEKVAICKVIVEFVKVDGIITPGEVAYLEQLEHSIGITQDLYNSAKNITLGDAIENLRHMSNENKDKFANILEELANSDNELAKEEVYFMLRIFGMAGLRPN